MLSVPLFLLSHCGNVETAAAVVNTLSGARVARFRGLFSRECIPLQVTPPRRRCFLPRPATAVLPELAASGEPSGPGTGTDRG